MGMNIVEKLQKNQLKCKEISLKDVNKMDMLQILKENLLGKLYIKLANYLVKLEYNDSKALNFLDRNVKID